MNEDYLITPWEVKGEIDYRRLIENFGLSIFKKLPEEFYKEILFRRKIIFAHRDIERIFNAIKNKEKFVMMTGLMPTGKFHLGHTLIVKQMIFYQKLGAKIYIAVADLEAYNTRKQSLEKSRKIAEEYIANYFALGLKEENCDIYFQSKRSKDSKKSNAYYSLQNLFARYVSFNELKSVYGEITPGKILSSLLQASDMIHPQLPEFEGQCPVVIPVGIDQDPHLRVARDIIQKIKNPKFIQISSTYNLFLPGLKGGKMSASDPYSYISLDDSEKVIEEKIYKHAFSGGKPTAEEQRKFGGDPDIDVCFQYLRMLLEENDEKLEEIFKDYKSGKMLTRELKDYTIKKIKFFLTEHRKKIKDAKKIAKKFI